MTVAADVPRLYTAPINVWVEDDLSRQYLRELWNDASVKFLVGGGREGVLALIRDAEQNAYRNVFGVVDRDFGKTNYNAWARATKDFRRFVLPVHELENYLLDDRALADCDLNTARRTQAAIRGRMQETARGLVSWMACRAVIVKLRDVAIDSFPEHPSCTDIHSLDDAEQYIRSSTWYKAIASRVAAISGEGTVGKMLAAAQQRYVGDLASVEWCRTFSGKEIFRAIRGYVYTPAGQVALSTLDADLAKSIARKQVELDSQPPELLALRAALRDRGGVP